MLTEPAIKLCVVIECCIDKAELTKGRTGVSSKTRCGEPVAMNSRERQRAEQAPPLRDDRRFLAIQNPMSQEKVSRRVGEDVPPLRINRVKRRDEAAKL